MAGDGVRVTWHTTTHLLGRVVCWPWALGERVCEREIMREEKDMEIHVHI